MEATSTRRAGLERFTFPKDSKPYFVLDLSNDLPASFAGGTMDIDPVKGRVTMGGLWGSRYDTDIFKLFILMISILQFWTRQLQLSGIRLLRFVGRGQTNSGRIRYLEWKSVCQLIILCLNMPYVDRRYGLDAKGLGMTHLNLTRNLIGDQYQYGALFSYSGQPKQINIRVGVSFVSADQACQNAEEEVGNSSFDDIMAQSQALWNAKLSKIEIDVANTPPNVTELLYSSLYRASLTPVCCDSNSI